MIAETSYDTAQRHVRTFDDAALARFIALESEGIGSIYLQAALYENDRRHRLAA